MKCRDLHRWGLGRLYGPRIVVILVSSMLFDWLVTLALRFFVGNGKGIEEWVERHAKTI